MYSGYVALRAALQKVYLCWRLAKWSDISAEYAFKICYVEGRQNVLAEYLSRAFGEVAPEEHKEEKHTIEHYFYKYIEEGL